MGKRVRRSKLSGITLVFLFCVIMFNLFGWSLATNITGNTMNRVSSSNLGRAFSFNIPFWDVVQGNPIRLGKPALLRLATLFNFRIGSPDSIIKSTIPLAEAVPNPPLPEALDLEEERVEPNHEQQLVSNETELETQSNEVSVDKGTPKGTIIIYNTHTGETYPPTDGVDRLPGKRGGVYQVASTLAKRLEELGGFKVIQSATIHDADFLRAYPYAESEKTLKSLLKSEDDVVLMIDVHRDANVPRDRSVVEIDGKKYATLMLVVGTNARLKHPNWTENYEFAQQIDEELDKKYPGLLRKIMTKNGRYNQHLHNHAILVEIGTCENSLEEANRSAVLLAEILYQQLQKSN